MFSEKPHSVAKRDIASFSDIRMPLRNWSIDLHPTTSSDSYIEWISTNLPDFQENRENAAILLQKYIEGVYYGYRKYNGPHAALPPLIMFEDPEEKFPDTYVDIQDSSIYIKTKFVEEFSVGSPRRMHTDRTEDKVYFEGSITSMFFLAGVEEGDHADFFKKNSTQEVIGAALSQAQYDAQPHELRALRTMLEYTQKHKLSRAIEIFAHRIEEAEKVILYK